MGKIGDLFVRLGLKSDDYKKGMKEAKKETNSFGQSLGKMKAGAVAVWAVIGTAVTKFANDFLHATNKVSDRWTAFMDGMKASYHSVLADLSNMKWKDFFKNPEGFKFKMLFNAVDAGKAAKEAAEAFDAEFELTHSIRLQREQVRGELNELYTMIRDTTLSPQDRQAAIQKYKSILEPLANAEIDVYTNMLTAAIKKWQAGNIGEGGLSRLYSDAEITEFFSKIGTDTEGMKAKYGELYSVFNNRKGDVQNQEIFDLLVKLEQAKNEMSNIDKEMARASLSIKKSLEEVYYIGGKSLDEILKEQTFSYGKEMAEDIREMNEAFAEIEDIEIDMSDVDNEMKAFLDEWKKDVDTFSQYNRMLEDSIVSATSNGLQALTDMMFGVEGADMKNVAAAFLAPFADTMKQMGSMIMAEGVAMKAFKESFKSPELAIAAGAALMAIGSAVSSGLQKMTQNPVGGGSMATSGASSYGNAENYESTLTVEVTGRISGNDIVLSGQKTNASKNR